MAGGEPDANATSGLRTNSNLLLRQFVRAHRRLVIYWGLVTLSSVATFFIVFVRIGFFGEQRDFWSIADGLATGACGGGLILLGASALQTWLTWLLRPQAAAPIKKRSKLQTAVAPVLAELETVRLDADRRIRRRAAWMTPVGVAAGAAYYFYDDSGALPLLAVFTFWGGVAGYVLAVGTLAGGYERLYKRRVLPRLVALFGPLTYERAPRLDLARLRRFHIFRHFTFARADDGIVGEYRGLQVSIVQLRLTRLKFLDYEVVFRGLLIEIGLKDRLVGTTAVASNAGAFGNLLDELAARDMRRVGLESAAFEHEYQVYATDQVMARALLTPDFMERFMALGQRPGFERPLALAQDNVLLLVMPRAAETRGGWDFFAAPGYAYPASDEGVLKSLYHDIEAVLRAADAVIDLDDATRAQASAPPPERGRRKARAGRSGDR